MEQTPEQETVNTAVLLERLDRLTSAVQHMAQNMGCRLNKGQLAQRFGVHRQTLRHRLAQDRSMPRPGPDGRWLLSEIVQWEQKQLRRH